MLNWNNIIRSAGVNAVPNIIWVDHQQFFSFYPYI